MREVIADMKENLVEKKITAYIWVEIKIMVAYILTKDKLDMLDMDDIVLNIEEDNGIYLGGN